MAGTMQVILDPRAAPGVPITPYARKTDASRPGLRVALLSNGFYDATKLLRAVAEALRAVLREPVVTLHERFNPTVLAEPELVAAMARDNDVAITALGHCGSCTSSATRDAVNLARAGLPVCTLISEKFYETSGFIARSVGMPTVPRVRLPHPVAGTGDARISEIARGAVAAVVAAWETCDA